MTAEERSEIRNGIWLCQTHSVLIDRDATSYPAATLWSWKEEHERRIGEELAAAGQGSGLDNAASQLVSIGPGIVAVGTVVAGGERNWTLRVEHFVEGDLRTLAAFNDSFASAPDDTRYVLCNEFGEGRLLSAAPTWRRTAEGVEVDCTLSCRIARKSAHDLGTDLAVNDNGDLVLRDGDLATTSGFESLPQTLMLSLSRYPGDSELNPDYGTRIAEFSRLYAGSRWFEQLVKLEVVRMASIPFNDEMRNDSYLPIACIERVVSLSMLEAQPDERRLAVEMVLDVTGVGIWAHKARLFLPGS